MRNSHGTEGLLQSLCWTCRNCHAQSPGESTPLSPWLFRIYLLEWGFALAQTSLIRIDDFFVSMIDPGGPGGSGRDLALRFGKNLSALTKGRYDYIGFDPRGIGASKPLTACFTSTLDYELFKSGRSFTHILDFFASYSRSGSYKFSSVSRINSRARIRHSQRSLLCRR